MKEAQHLFSRAHRFLNSGTNHQIIITHLFLRGLGLIYFIAFFSLWLQIDGLIGSEGILPAQRFLENFQEQTGGGFGELPTLFWLNSSDVMLNALALAGALLAFAAILLPFSTILWGLLWVLYLSLFNVGQVFLSFQWDILLLETGFLAIFLLPFSLVPRYRLNRLPNGLAIWLFRWLLFRLMFASGVVKLASMDPSWWNLTALNFHYFTQPIPPWTAWYAHQLPEWFQKTSVGGMFFVELVLPFFILGSRRFRMFAGLGLVTLQVLIILTGNYCFFNLLTILFCLWLFDDRIIPKISVPNWFTRFCQKMVVVPSTKFDDENPMPGYTLLKLTGRIISYISAVLLIMVSVMLLISATFRIQVNWPNPLVKLYFLQAKFNLVNNYGLFADMTERRLEISIEGSNDNKNWQTYKFKYKPEDLENAPPFVAPHQPRLDWQMWFAALGNFRQNPWFVNFCVRLLQGSEPVIKLLAHNPFPGNPPLYIRARLYDYQFTSFEERQSSGNWWRRKYTGEYLPTLSRENLPYLLEQLRLK